MYVGNNPIRFLDPLGEMMADSTDVKHVPTDQVPGYGHFMADIRIFREPGSTEWTVNTVFRIRIANDAPESVQWDASKEEEEHKQQYLGARTDTGFADLDKQLQEVYNIAYQAALDQGQSRAQARTAANNAWVSYARAALAEIEQRFNEYKNRYERERGEGGGSSPRPPPLPQPDRPRMN